MLRWPHLCPKASDALGHSGYVTLLHDVRSATTRVRPPWEWGETQSPLNVSQTSGAPALACVPLSGRLCTSMFFSPAPLLPGLVVHWGAVACGIKRCIQSTWGTGLHDKWAAGLCLLIVVLQVWAAVHPLVHMSLSIKQSQVVITCVINFLFLFLVKFYLIEVCVYSTVIQLFIYIFLFTFFSLISYYKI